MIIIDMLNKLMADLINGWAKVKIKQSIKEKEKVKLIIINFLNKQA